MIGRVGDDFMADRVLSSLQEANVRSRFHFSRCQGFDGGMLYSC